GPARGVHAAFEKLYANRQKGDAGFSVRYVSGTGAALGAMLAAAGTLLLWGGLLSLGGWPWPLPRAAAASVALAGAAGMLAAILMLDASPLVVVWPSIAALAVRGWSMWRARRAPAPSAAGAVGGRGP